MKKFWFILILLLPPGLIVLWAFLPDSGIFGKEFTRSTWWYLVILYIMFGVMFLTGLLLSFLPQLSSRNKKRILKIGRPAKGIVKEIGESSIGTVKINGQPFVSLKVEVDDGMRTPYIVNLETVIPRLSLPAFQPGMEIPLKVDPEDNENVAIDRDKLSNTKNIQEGE
jgi:hypothetical protein